MLSLRRSVRGYGRNGRILSEQRAREEEIVGLRLGFSLIRAKIQTISVPIESEKSF